MSSEKMKVTTEMLRKGATMLAEPCPSCGGVQVKYNGKVYCTNHDDLSGTLGEKLTYDSLAANLREVLLAKLNESIQLLKKEKGRPEQEALVALMTGYVDLLQKLPQN